MKHLNKLAFVLLTIFAVSCSSEPETLKQEDIDNLTKNKQIYYLSYSSSGDLKYDFPSTAIINYVENDTEYSQKLHTTGLQEPKKENPVFKKKRYTVSANELENFDYEKVIQNAINFIKKESNDSFECFAVSSIIFRTNINWKKQNEISREITIQATQKGEKSEYKLSRRKVTSVKNFYEFEFDILENSEVKLKK